MAYVALGTFNHRLNALWCGRNIHLLLFHHSYCILHTFFLEAAWLLNTHLHRFWFWSHGGLLLEKMTEGVCFLSEALLSCCFAFDHHSRGLRWNRGWFQIWMTQLLPGDKKKMESYIQCVNKSVNANNGAGVSG